MEQCIYIAVAQAVMARYEVAGSHEVAGGSMRCLHGLAKRSDQRLCHEKRVIGRGLSVT